MTTRQLSFRSCLVVSVRRCGCQCHSQDGCRCRQQLQQYFSWGQQPEVPTMYLLAFTQTSCAAARGHSAEPTLLQHMLELHATMPRYPCWCSAALPVIATAEADDIASALGELLQSYGERVICTPHLQGVAAGIAHSLCAAQVSGWLKRFKFCNTHTSCPSTGFCMCTQAPCC